MNAHFSRQCNHGESQSHNGGTWKGIWREINFDSNFGAKSEYGYKDTIFALSEKLGWKILSQNLIWTRMKYGSHTIFDALAL